MITRHFVDVGARRVHYRRAGSGPPLLMVHQSPRSSAEYEPLIRAWAAHFTIVAPDTPGFGQSDPLPDAAPEVEDYADAVVDLLDALGLPRVGAYGFHSGAIILVTAAKRHPDRFAAIAANGYAVWLPEEREVFGARYTPAFVPQPYGEHLVWAWNRILEQSWFFPWYDTRDETRLPIAGDDPAAFHPAVMDLLASGDAYRLGYGAVLRANRDVPPAGAPTPPTLLTAADADPLQKHIARLGPLPPQWRVEPAATRADTDALCLAHLRAHPAPANPAALPEAADAGFVHVVAGGFDGLVHWRGDRGADRLVLPAPGRAAALIGMGEGLAIDLPGHGLSDDWQEGAAPDLAAWVAVAAAAGRALSDRIAVVVGEGWSALLAIAVAQALGAPTAQALDGVLPDAAADWPELPDLTPDRHGAYLLRAWSAVRAARFFWPWFRASAATAIPFAPEAVAPDRLAAAHLALLQARRGQGLLDLLRGIDRDRLMQDAALGRLEVRWPLPDWAAARDDVWRPKPSTV